MAVAPVQRRLAAILAADVVGYSRLMERDEADTFARLKSVRKVVVEPILAQNGGRFVDLKGDGAIVEFQSVVAAVLAATEIQTSMQKIDSGLPEERRIRYRIGVNLGEVIVDDDTIYGDGVNVAARIESLCEPGGVWLSRSVYNQVRGKLDLALVPSGLHQVKNISEAVETFRVALDGVEPVRLTSARRRNSIPIAVAAAAALMLAVSTGTWLLWPQSEPVGWPSVAVLPFDNLGRDEETDRLADGITEDVITDLAHFRDLDVIARSSTEPYRERRADVRTIGKELRVSYVLQGSIQRQGRQVRVSAQLASVSTGAYVWSDRWEGSVEDVFAVQTQVADKVANSLGGYGSLAHAGQVNAKRKRPEDLTAYDLYLLATEHKHRRTDVAEVEQAKELYSRALAADPKFARAYVGRAWTHLILTFYGPPYDFEAGLAAMEADARSAVALDHQDGEAHAVLGEALYYQGKYGESVSEYDKALQLNPSSADIAAFAAGILCFLGQPERAAQLADRAVRLNPVYPSFYAYYLGPAYYFAERPADAIRVLESLPPEQRYELGWVLLAASYAMDGNEAAAAAARREALKVAPSFSAEGGLNSLWRIVREQERLLLVTGVRKAGLPVCESEESLTALGAKERLPECEVEREKSSTVN